MNLTIYTDGGSSGNPGPAASAFVLTIGTTEIHKEATLIGIGTNNTAEYTALILALKKVKEIIKNPQYKDLSQIEIFSDSLLMVMQLKGKYKVKDAKIQQSLAQIRGLESEVNLPLSYTHVPREQNKEADALVRSVLYP